MSARWFVYRDIKGFPRQQFEDLAAPKPGDQLIRDQVFPGQGDFPPMHIKHHQLTIDGAEVHLITYTEQPVGDREAEALARRALERPA